MTAQHTASEVRRSMYYGARRIGDAQALARGPVPFAKRYARRRVYRAVNANLGKALKGFGL